VDEHTLVRVTDNPLLHDLWEPAARRSYKAYGDCDNWVEKRFLETKTNTDEERELFGMIGRDQEYCRSKATQYAWAIPTEEALAVLTKLSPLVEVRPFARIAATTLTPSVRPRHGCADRMWTWLLGGALRRARRRRRRSGLVRGWLDEGDAASKMVS